MNENIIKLFLKRKKNNLNQYAKLIISILMVEKKITKETKHFYLEKTKNILDEYVEDMYFSNSDIFANIKSIVSNNINQTNIMNCASIAHICIEIDKIICPVLTLKISTLDIKIKVANLLKLLSINVEEKNNKDNILLLAKLVKDNYNLENKFFKEFSEITNIKNNFVKQNMIKDTYLVKVDYEITALENYYPSQVNKVLSLDTLVADFQIVSTLLLAITILKQLLLYKKSDRFIIKINKEVLDSKRKFNDIKRQIENIKNAVIFLINYEDYKKNKMFLQKLKDEGYNYFVDLSKENENDYSMLEEKEIILVKPNFVDESNYLDDRQIIYIENTLGKVFSEKELISQKLEV